MRQLAPNVAQAYPVAAGASAPVDPDFVLTTAAWSMFSHPEGLTVHIKPISVGFARKLATDDLVAVVRNPEMGAMVETVLGIEPDRRRSVTLRPGDTAIALGYRGAPIGVDGAVPPDGMVQAFLLECEAYQDEDLD